MHAKKKNYCGHVPLHTKVRNQQVNTFGNAKGRSTKDLVKDYGEKMSLPSQLSILLPGGVADVGSTSAINMLNTSKEIVTETPPVPGR